MPNKAQNVYVWSERDKREYEMWLEQVDPPAPPRWVGWLATAVRWLVIGACYVGIGIVLGFVGWGVWELWQTIGRIQ